MLTDAWHEVINAVQHSPIFKGAMSTGLGLLILLCVLAILAGVTFMLRRFFKRNAEIRRAHKFLIYLLTMLGVIILLFGGILGIFVPIVPGLLLIFLAMLLLRRYHKNKWVDSKLKYLSWRLRIKLGVQRAREKIKARGKKIGKALRKKRKDRHKVIEDEGTHK